MTGIKGPEDSGPVGVLNPYSVAVKYREAWWKGPLPLPHKKKEKPPLHWTGHKASYPTVEQITEWLDNPNKRQQNICLRIAGVDNEYEVIGIDVDHYIKGDREKRGGDQLRELEAKLGKLPETWISSARTDGISGIRYFLVPRGLAFRGQVAKDIECISRGYRYVVVWPSIHPDGMLYWWFPPGVLPDKDGQSAWNGEIPRATDLPLLPEAWLEYLSLGEVRTQDRQVKDENTSWGDLQDWAENTFHGYDEKLCPTMRDKVDKHKKLLKEEASSYHYMTDAHMNVIKLAFEGHVGCGSAIKEVCDSYRSVCIERDKRDDNETISGELFRSVSGAFRKIKPKVEENEKAGVTAIAVRCDQPGGLCRRSEHAPPDRPDGPDGLSSKRNKLKDCGDYELNDDGNAEHFNDWFIDGDDPLQHWVEGYGWIVWEKSKDYDFFQWKLDKGNKVMRQRWWAVKKRQEDYAANLRIDYLSDLRDALSKVGQPNGPVNITAAKALLSGDKKLMDDWESFSRTSGNNRQFNEMLVALTHRTDIRKLFSELDNQPYLMGVANGVLELGDTVRLRDPRPSDYITLNTNIPYEKPTQLAADTWQNYLDTFLPDKDLQRTAQIALGHCLFGKNDEKIMLVLKGRTNTGKSTMVNSIAAALGDYATSVGMGIFQEKNFNEDVYNAYGKRFVYHSESGEKTQYSPSMIKRLSAGIDPLVSNIKGSMEQLRYQPSFVLILMTNEAPNIPGADQALLGRLYVIPFEIMPEHIDKKGGDVVKAICGVAIQNWLLDGYTQYRVIGELPRTQTIIEETEIFFSELDDMTNFVCDGLIKHHNMNGKVDWSMQPEWRVKRADMYSHFQAWWRSIGRSEHDRPSAIAVTKRLRAMGIPGSRHNGNVTHGGETARWWYGVQLTAGFRTSSGATVFQMKPRD